MEFDQAMEVWAKENEPTYIVQYMNYETLQVERREFVFLFEAVSFLKACRHEDYLHESSRKAFIDTHYPTSWGNIPMKYYKPGDGPEIPHYAGNPDHLDGGSRADYKMAGYKRF